MQKIPMIDHVTKVKEKVHLLDVLKEIDVINKYIQLIILDVQKYIFFVTLAYPAFILLTAKGLAETA